MSFFSKKTFVIAELGINHGGNINTAYKLIKSASKSGVDAVKFQTYLTEKRVPKKSKIYNILKNCELPFTSFKKLKDYAESCGVIFFSTAFDKESFDYLESIKVKLYKIASFDVTNLNLIKTISSSKKPIIISRGMATLSEIKKAYNLIQNKVNKIGLLHCVSSYPLKEKDANLKAIDTLKNNFKNCVPGYSDHTPDIKTSIYAVAGGAQIIEKHYKISNSMKCVDAPVSISFKQMERLVKEIRMLEKIFGEGKLICLRSEKGTKIFRRKSK